MSRFLLFTVTLAVLLAHLLVPAYASAAGCRFVLGFATLKALIDEAEGPEKVGECLEDEHFNVINGDSLQQTTGGLMVWRKHDNWTAFTDGYRTWINGPYGLQKRLNTARFDWEEEPPPVAAPEAAAAEVPRVLVPDLSVCRPGGLNRSLQCHGRGELGHKQELAERCALGQVVRGTN